MLIESGKTAIIKFVEEEALGGARHLPIRDRSGFMELMILLKVIVELINSILTIIKNITKHIKK